VVCLETASLPAPCLSTSTSPRSREEPKIKHDERLEMTQYTQDTQARLLRDRNAMKTGLPLTACLYMSILFQATI
ncbi:hypothetical protein, partial [Aeromonas caviae]|uniref:hypothetical protein n=1 Tax=Aeromonas caviae TaxID=648 RepID=UPI002B461BA8